MDNRLAVRGVFVFFFVTRSVFASLDNNQESSPSTVDAFQSHPYFFYQRSEYPKDCRDVQRQCSTSSSSGVYLIKPDGYEEPFEVFCNHDVGTGGWTVIQRRTDGSVNFNRNWLEYKEGFGFFATDFWIGNKKLSYLTNQAIYELRMDMTLSNGSSLHSSYKGFRIADEWSRYNIVNLIALDSNVDSLISACPSNKIFGICNCQGTCNYPNRTSGCDNDCLGSEGCICPAGFLMQESDCIPAEECGCFVTEANLVIPNGETFVSDDCTQKCSCSNNRLTCEVDYSCSTNAVCDVKNGVRQCYCNEGYEGDGETCEVLYTDCKDVHDAGHTEDGVYTILPTGWPDSPFSVYCKMNHGGGWTVFQRRSGGSTSFSQNWDAYKEGFGDLNDDFWLGNEKLYYLTHQAGYTLRFDVVTSGGDQKYASYTEFQIESEGNKYRLNKLGNHTGTTGTRIGNNRGKAFSTHGRDNDECDNFNCAEGHRGGWWHSDHWCGSYCCSNNFCEHFPYRGSCNTVCTSDNLNGDYNGDRGENIFSDHNAYCNLRFTEMKIRPSS
ncbi:uncharacterized protein [Apostichopus japonicus]|uniref:uncharacterized protein n=1 Tax=Stichopus japonicus TaxID=307972 RepID=UPI003AB8293A